MKPDPQIVRIAKSLSVRVTADLAGQLQIFKDELLRTNDRVNLVSRQDSAVVVDRLIADSLVIADYMTPIPGAKLLDIGSGAGFPWIPIKLVHRELNVVSVDANRRKIEFQRSITRLLKLNHCEFFPERIESIPPQSADVVVAKAVTGLATLETWAAPHTKSGGLLILPRGATEEFASGSPGPGWALVEKKAYGTTVAQNSGKLLIFRKL